MNKEPIEGLEYDFNMDEEDDEDYRKPLRAPRNRENVFGAIPGNIQEGNASILEMTIIPRITLSIISITYF